MSSSTASVTVHALSSGFITLPVIAFVHPVAEDEKITVPSLSFLIQHLTSPTSEPVRLLFDLGIRRIHSNYPAPLRNHLKTREPFSTIPDVTESLRKGGLNPSDIDFVVLSHVHWDHVGTPSDFENATFIVGHGSLALLKNGSNPSAGSHAHFEADLLPEDRTIELPAPGQPYDPSALNPTILQKLNPDGLQYTTLDNLTAIDLFNTGLVHLIDAPGHLPGHQNLLVRASPTKWIYLAGDAAHDRRLLRGTHSIGMWENEEGRTCSIHFDVDLVRETLEGIRRLEVEGLRGCEVEVVLAHDVEWIGRRGNEGRFWPGEM